MHKTGAFVCFVLTLPLIGTVKKAVPVLPARDLSVQRKELLQRHQQSVALFQSGRYSQAAAMNQRNYSEACALDTNDLAAKSLIALGACRLALQQYQEALDLFLKGRELAKRAGEYQLVQVASLNISDLYYQMGDPEAAAESAERALLQQKGNKPTQFRAQLLLELAWIRFKQNRTNEAVAVSLQGIDEADRNGDLVLYATGWARLGQELLLKSKLPESERALLEAFRLRKLFKLSGLDASYRELGMLRLAQGDLRSASALLDQAVNLCNEGRSLWNAWDAYCQRGRLRMAENRLPEALADLRRAVELAKRWRRAAPPDDATRISMDESVQSAYSPLIQAANQSYFASHDPALARESFEAAEENRAASLRALLAQPSSWRRALPPEYWDALKEWQTAEVDLLQRGDEAARARLRSLRTRVMQMEFRAGSKDVLNLSAPDALRRLQNWLESDAAYLGFHLGESESYLWAISRERWELDRLPSRSMLAAEIKEFVTAVQQGRAESVSAGKNLYQELFGRLDASFHAKPRWLLALDQQLFELPFAALVAGEAQDGPVYLIQQHSLQITSGALSLLAPRLNRAANQNETDPFSGTFLGIGDAIYNTADPRRNHSAHIKTPDWLAWFNLPVWAKSSSPALMLPRLAGSGREIRSCARLWSKSVLLEGADASMAKVRQMLQSQPSAIHFAAHVVQARQPPYHGLIALSLSNSGESEFLSPVTIAAENIHPALVVLSGCRSGLARVVPGAGLMGMTRAWLVAGARSVAASLWPAPDDSGALFLAMYKHLAAAPTDPDAALRLAQLDMLRCGNWRAQSKYWAAYFLVGNY